MSGMRAESKRLSNLHMNGLASIKMSSQLALLPRPPVTGW